VPPTNPGAEFKRAERAELSQTSSAARLVSHGVPHTGDGGARRPSEDHPDVAASCTPQRRAKVCIVQSVLKQYRVPLFAKLAERLATEGLELRVVYGDPNAAAMSRADNVDVDAPWAHKVPSRWLLGDRLLYQSGFAELRSADLVVLEHANKFLLNYLLLALPRSRRPKIAFWGHGRNRQATRMSVSEQIKRHTLLWVDWWFAYTSGVADYVVARGFPRERVSIMGNTTDTDSFREALGRVTEADLKAFRARWHVRPEAVVGLFCGSLYPEKHIEFLVDAAHLIRRAVPEFELVIAGGGPQANLARRLANPVEWIHYVGPLFGLDKAACFASAKVFLNPGLVGLSVVDALCAGLPVFSTDVPIHSPEIEYLSSGINGVISGFDRDHYAEAVSSALRDEPVYRRLREGALHSAEAFSLEKMVETIVSGMTTCLRSDVGCKPS
jgi:glycosyltransferase involved in cell wall biosynthesis